MATRAFNILEQRNENQHVGKSLVTGKNENRVPFKAALKDLTNSCTTRPNLNSGNKQDAFPKKPIQQKRIAPKISQKKSLEKIQPTKKTSFNIFTPQDAEYSWGKETCLREDLLEQMIEFAGVVYKHEKLPMKPIKAEKSEIPEFALPTEIKCKKPSIPKELPSSFLFNLQEIDLPDLEYMF